MTQIFKTEYDFREREDQKVNGVSPTHAVEYPNYEEDNKSNDSCWNCSDCSGCYRCSDCQQSEQSYRCSNCSGCSGCSDCSGCSGCSRVAYLDNKKEIQDIMGNYPVIENIHQKVFEAASGKDALDMSDWHSCDTTHCRAGWVVHLAGPRGYELEKHTSSVFAAMQIYNASGPIKVSPVSFYVGNEEALEDMKRCAEEETVKLEIQ